MSIRKTLTPELLIDLYIRKNFSLHEIGAQYGVSRQRVHQLKKEYEEKHGKFTRRKMIDVMTLKEHLESGDSITKIAEKFCFSPSKISRLIRKYQSDYETGHSNIFIEKKKAEDLLPHFLLYQLYVVDLLTDKEISAKFGVSSSTVNMLRKKYHIPTNPSKKLRKLPLKLTKEKFVFLYIKKGKTLEEIADSFDCSIRSVVELKKQYLPAS